MSSRASARVAVTERAFRARRKWRRPPYEQSTVSLNGGRCFDPAAICHTLPTATAYVDPTLVIQAIDELKPSQWFTLQQYLLTTGVNPVYGVNKDQWDCTAPKAADHWTTDAERYCCVDAQLIYKALAARVAAGQLVVTDPGTVEAAFGRTGYSDLAIPPPPK